MGKIPAETTTIVALARLTKEAFHQAIEKESTDLTIGRTKGAREAFAAMHNV